MSSHRNRAALVALTLTAVLGAGATQVGAAEPSFRGVGRVRAGDVTDAVAVSGDGSVVAGHSSDGTDAVAFRWTADGGIQSLGRLEGRPGSTGAVAVSLDGSTIVGHAGMSVGTLPAGFRWTAGTGMTGLGNLTGSVSEYATAYGTSADGSYVVGASMNGSRQIEAYRWSSATGMVGLGLLPGATYPQSTALDVTPDGAVIVGSSIDAAGFRAVRWTPLDIEPLAQVPGATYSTAAAVSRDGSVIVGSVIPAGREVATPFRWTETGGMKLLRESPAGEKEYASDVSGDGSIVVGRADFGAFVWDPFRGMRDLRTVLENEYGLAEALRGWQLNIAYGISDDGTAIVGSGTNPQGAQEGFVVILPEPTGFALAAAGAFFLSLRRLRRA